MNIYDPYTCVLCSEKMHTGTHPYWIIDPESLEVRGIAHKGCRDKLDYRTVEYSLTTPVKLWGARPPLSDLVSDPPSREMIEFAARMIRYRLSLPQWEKDVDFKIILLAYKTYQATNIEELLELPKIKELFAWWGDSMHRNPMTDEELEEVKRRLRENLGVRS